MNSPAIDHADKYDDPRAKITSRGVAIGIGVVLLGILGSGLSIWARRTQLEQTTEFWGPDVITAFQLAEEVELAPEPEDPEAEPNWVRLSGMPGLGHLRHAFLDDRSYQWQSVRDEPIAPQIDQSECVTLRFRDPTAKRFPDTRIVVNLETGWVGKQNGDRQVQLNSRFRKAIPSYLQQIADYEPIRVEMRKKEEAEG